MFDDDDDYHDWGPRPSIELAHKSIDFNLLLWKTGASYQVMLWERGAMGNKIAKGHGTDDYEDALNYFATQMNELEMYK